METKPRLVPAQLTHQFWGFVAGFRAGALRTIQSLVSGHREEFLEAWNEFFGIGGR